MRKGTDIDGRACVVLGSTKYDPDEVMEYARQIGACFCTDRERVYLISLPGLGAEEYTERALRRSLHS